MNTSSVIREHRNKRMGSFRIKAELRVSLNAEVSRKSALVTLVEYFFFLKNFQQIYTTKDNICRPDMNKHPKRGPAPRAFSG